MGGLGRGKKIDNNENENDNYSAKIPGDGEATGETLVER